MLFTTYRLLTDLQFTGVPSSVSDHLLECSRLDDGTFTAAEPAHVLPPEAWGGAGPTIFKESDSVMIAVFTVTRGRGRDKQTDLGISTMRAGVWSEPDVLTSCSSPSWEAQPFFSRDGSLLAFASDRPGGLGGMDIWISTREAGGWGPPRNAGRVINGPANEFTPSFDADGQLLYATDAWLSSGYEIMRTVATDTAHWGRSERLPAPINSRYDDISPVVWGDSIFFASKRPGGCGGFDLYGMVLCGPVLLRGQVTASKSIVRRSGIVTVLDSTGRLQQSSVREDGSFEIKILPRRSYLIRYVNECSYEAIEQRFTAPCNETAAVVMQSSMALPEIPPSVLVTLDRGFFTPGAYRPLTSAALTTLRLQKDMNLMGSDAVPLRFRSVPASADEDARRVDLALADICAGIIRTMEWYHRGCSPKRSVDIIVTGYPDDVARTDDERYDEASVTDSSTSVSVARGASLDDATLASLRALTMKRMLQDRLASALPSYLHATDIHWSVVVGSRTGWSAASRLRKIDIDVR
ncbi:MAG: TolB family protein [Candidatus Kapaibacterium sp.]